MESQLDVAKTLSSLAQTKQLGGNGSASDLGDAAQKFEAFFIQSMLKSMRSASLSSGLLDSDKSDFYRDWHDQQLATDLASKETFAVAKLLQRQFAGQPADATLDVNLKIDPLFRRSSISSLGAPDSQEATTQVASLGISSGSTGGPINTTLKQIVTDEIQETSGITSTYELSAPEQFVQEIYPYAHQAATKLNTSADVLVAIAALETGWGLHRPQAGYGQDSHNYFGIKANNWQGPEVTNVTHEFDGEKTIKIQDKFRVYETPADSFNDFAEFLLSNPRYQDAIRNASDVKSFAAELQKAGYATDPNYAKKINSIMDGSILKNAIHSLNEQASAGDVTSEYQAKNTH
ncbi:MAG: flagellar assembly peptidoglycan hydrolase FlgJ [Gammaproteobacteria bacterium]|nr:MAG: flagellar assembly peptidoglycan hydrolase FlgJ [Gammaproteobacteria bacterium]